MRDTGPILVPLDGSELAEGAIAWAAALAGALNERIVLVTAWEGTDTELGVSFPTLAQDMEQQATAHFGAYLDKIKQRVGQGVQVETMIRSGEAGDEIMKACDETGARMLVIATHGRSGIGRWFYGSTASHLLRHAGVPVVAVGPNALEKGQASVSMKHVMVPLDGSATAEKALPVAQQLAKASGARMSLVRAVQWAVQAYPYTLPDMYLPQVDQELEGGAKKYLQRMEAAVTDAPVSAFVVRGAVSEGLLEFVDKESVDFVVMMTNARAGLARMALGSVADRMLQSSAPVMLIRPEVANA
jgi:nucleotide-binding universal stress UspA family protein